MRTRIQLALTPSFDKEVLSMKKKILIISGILALCLIGYLVFKPGKFSYQAPLFDHLGSFNRPVTTTVPMAQRYFNQGMVLFYGFDWSESARSFKEAARLDPNCAMCYWGLSLALANKINAPMNGNEFAEGEAAIHQALALSSTGSPIEQELIQALALSYLHAPVLQKETSVFSCHESSSLKETANNSDKIAYINSLAQIAAKYPQDLEAQTLYASALFFALIPTNPEENDPGIQEATRVLQNALAIDPSHIGANHYYIHLIEPYSHPEYALDSAARLKTLVPGAPHLVHMPAHIYFLTGHYHEGTESNLQAIEAYKKYNATCHKQGFEPEINYLYFHNYDFLRTTASMEGNQAIALRAAKQMVDAPYPLWLAESPSLQWFMPIPFFVEARFGLWDEILKEAQPDPKYGYALGMWHYARGMAQAHTGKLEEALAEAVSLQQIVSQGPIESNLGETGLKLLSISNSILYAKIADKIGDQKLTLDHLIYAMKVQDSIPYHEPPDWYFPVRQALGDAYFKWGDFHSAKAMYELDLTQYPANGWSLFGLEKSLRALGQHEKADLAHGQFLRAWAHADIPEPIPML
jgi:tetratricopeptide (TPR) repeat protein